MSRSPRSVLFACNWNTVRSPMAAALLRARAGGLRVESCGLAAGDEADAFARAVLTEIGVELGEHRPRSLQDVPLESFDIVISLTPQARERIEAPGRIHEYWPSEDPTAAGGSREQRLDAYRDVRDALRRRLDQRFGREDAYG